MRNAAALFSLPLVALFSASVAAQTAGPVISDLRVEPSSGPPGSSYTVSVRILSPQDPDEIVPVLNEVRENQEKIEVGIRDDGLDGDAVRGDGRYSGRIRVPETAAEQTHRFQVYIHDTAGRMSNVLEYRFTVLRDTAI
jgi:hypothetical protein